MMGTEKYGGMGDYTKEQGNCDETCGNIRKDRKMVIIRRKSLKKGKNFHRKKPYGYWGIQKKWEIRVFRN